MAKQKPQMNAMMRQVQQMQSEMLAAQEALASETIEATSGGGMVKAVVSGSGELREVIISPEVVDPEDIEMLQDLVVAAVGEALREAEARKNAALGGATGGLDLDKFGLGGLLG
jgi:DNA-binding YbaB/EbfC family protein